jgi:hypothetical protein
MSKLQAIVTFYSRERSCRDITCYSPESKEKKLEKRRKIAKSDSGGFRFKGLGVVTLQGIYS